MRGCLKKPSRQAPEREPEEVVHALGRLREQRHVGVGAASRDVVGPAVVEVDALALEAADVGGGVGLHADDRLDPGCLAFCRTRRPRTRCRGRSSRSPACRARRPAGSGRRAGPHRRAWSTRCGRAGGRTSRCGPVVMMVLGGLLDGRIVGACEQSCGHGRLDAGRRGSWGKERSAYATAVAMRGTDATDSPRCAGLTPPRCPRRRGSR